jgi:DNA-directed RNA polymerase specialized sigma24 family protein
MSLPQPVTADPPSDAALIAAWQRGDERAAAALVERHARPLARFLAGAGAPDADLDDVVQETFIRAFRSVDRFRGQCQFRTWLLTIGGNVLKDFGRRAARRRVLPLDEGVRDVRGDPHQHAEASESEALLALVDELWPGVSSPGHEQLALDVLARLRPAFPPAAACLRRRTISSPPG